MWGDIEGAVLPAYNTNLMMVVLILNLTQIKSVTPYFFGSPNKFILTHRPALAPIHIRTNLAPMPGQVAVWCLPELPSAPLADDANL